TTSITSESTVRLPPADLFWRDTNNTLESRRVNALLCWAYANEERWATWVACYLQTGVRSPKDIGRFWDYASALNGYRRDWRKLDIFNASGQSIRPFAIPLGDRDLQELWQHSCTLEGQVTFENVVSRWARDVNNKALVEEILERTFWTNGFPLNDDWHVIDDILKMPEGPEKSIKVAQAKVESPLFFAACLEDDYCGMVRETVKRSVSDEEEAEDIYHIEQRTTGPYRKYVTTKFSSKRRKLNPTPEEIKHMMANGRPTQIHAVPEEERAIDENGNRLPWALEWPDDHPNARGQKRRPVESGPFGKSMRRKGSSRATRTATRTATPAKKESSAADGFFRGLEEDKRRAELYGEGRDTVASNAALQQDNMTAPASKEPVYVMLYGFSPSTQWAAISHYERASGGMICEDYDRHPPSEARRIPATFSSPGMGHRRALTTTERKMSMGYKGGNAWIRVTFDSAEAAERACHFSPHVIQGHWVYAELYADGIVPNNDEPIPFRPEDRQGDLTTSANPTYTPTHKTAQSLGPALGRNMQSKQPQASATLPRSFISNGLAQQNVSQRPEAESASPSTASSATATAPTMGSENATLRQRGSRTQGGSQSQLGAPAAAHQQQQQQQQGNIQYMTHFPDIPRTVLRPAHEAFLPQPTVTQKWITYFRKLGVIPGDVIGHVVPRTESGEFDYANASFYWRFFYWLDSSFGTNLCGLRDD
ncbi:MAG: hypothetical protein Q9201_007194, partial [Fulgogasparrea decipioides]